MDQDANDSETSFSATADDDIQEMMNQIKKWGSISLDGFTISRISGTADDPSQMYGTATKSDHGFDGYNGTWEIGNWGNTLVLTK